MSILGIVGVVVQLLLAFVNYLSGKQKLEAESATTIATNLQGVLDEVSKVQTARNIVAARVNADPGSVRKPQPDDRPFDPNATG